MLAGFPKRLGRRARKVRWDARRTDAPEDSRGRPRGNKNAMGKAISPSAWQLGWGKHQGKIAYLAGVGAEAGFALVDLRFQFCRAECRGEQVVQHTVGRDESDGRGSTRAQLQPEVGQYGQSMGRNAQQAASG